ncbi:MAG: hypothetical protein ABJE10_23590 [bacterium]
MNRRLAFSMTLGALALVAVAAHSANARPVRHTVQVASVASADDSTVAEHSGYIIASS